MAPVSRTSISMQRPSAVFASRRPLGRSANQVAELAFALMLALARAIVPAHNSAVSGGWPRWSGSSSGEGPVCRAGQDCGHIAQGGRSAGSGIRDDGHCEPIPMPSPNAAGEVELVQLEDLLRRSDLFCVHAAVTTGRRLDRRRRARAHAPVSLSRVEVEATRCAGRRGGPVPGARERRDRRCRARRIHS